MFKYCLALVFVIKLCVKPWIIMPCKLLIMNFVLLSACDLLLCTTLHEVLAKLINVKSIIKLQT